MKRIKLSVREIIALSVFNEMSDALDEFNHVCDTPISNQIVGNIIDHIDNMKNSISKLNFYMQLLTHPMGIDEYDQMKSDKWFSSHILASLHASYHPSDIESDLKKGDKEKKLIDYLFSALDGYIGDGEETIKILTDVLDVIKDLEE